MRCSLQVRSPGGPHPCSPRSIVSDNCSSPFSQPLPTLKESGGLKITVWYSPGLRALGPVGYSGRGRDLASSWPPAPPHAFSAKTRSVPSSPTTSSAALALRLLTPVMHLPFSSLLSKGESLKRRPTESWLLHGQHTPLWGQVYHSNGLSLRLLGRCMPITNFVELRKGEVRRIPLKRTSQNSNSRHSAE